MSASSIGSPTTPRTRLRSLYTVRSVQEGEDEGEGDGDTVRSEQSGLLSPGVGGEAELEARMAAAGEAAEGEGAPTSPSSSADAHPSEANTSVEASSDAEDDAGEGGTEEGGAEGEGEGEGEGERSQKAQRSKLKGALAELESLRRRHAKITEQGKLLIGA